SFTRFCHLHDEFDFDRDVARQDARADRRACVDAALAEGVLEQLGCAVDHGRRRAEPGRAVDEREHLDDPGDALEVADLAAQAREARDDAQPCCLLALLERELSADLPAHRSRAVGGERAVAGRVDEVARADRAHVAAEWRRRVDERVAAGRELLLRGHDASLVAERRPPLRPARCSFHHSTTAALKTSWTLRPPVKMLTKWNASESSSPASRTIRSKSSCETPAARPLIIRSYFGRRSSSRYAWYAASAPSRSPPRPASRWRASSVALRHESPIPCPKIGSLCWPASPTSAHPRPAGTRMKLTRSPRPRTGAIRRARASLRPIRGSARIRSSKRRSWSRRNSSYSA